MRKLILFLSLLLTCFFALPGWGQTPIPVKLQAATPTLQQTGGLWISGEAKVGTLSATSIGSTKTGGTFGTFKLYSATSVLGWFLQADADGDATWFNLLGSANTWTANQTAPYWLSSVQYDPNNPRPYGFPYGVTANANDLEFNGANPMTDTADLDSSTTEIPGWITMDTAGLAKKGLAYKTLVNAFAADSVIDCRAHISNNAWTNGSTVVLAFLYDNAGSMDGWYAGLMGNNGYWIRVWGTVTNYVLSAPTATTIYDYKPYIGLYRLATGDLYFTDSEDGITWGAYARLTTGTNKAFTVFGVGADLSANSIPENNTVAVDWVRFK